MIFNEIITRIVGVYMFLASIFGISINSYMFHHFFTIQKSSFHYLCSSKTISNSLTLLIYFFFIAPVNALYTDIGSRNLNSYLNQAMGFGLLLQGPFVQCMITINRFLVVWIYPVSEPKYSIPVTIGALSISWIFTIWFSTLIGLPDNCRVPFGFAHNEIINSACNLQITWYLVYSLFVLAVFTNALNLLIALKLFCLSKINKTLSSETAKSRRKLSIRFFLQSCFQDWIMVFDSVNSFLSTIYCTSRVCNGLITFGLNVSIYGVDGIIMYIFNRKLSVQKTSDARKSTKNSSNFMRQSMMTEVSP